jgi:predicted RNA binding protein YcfA (HicA-like mRNA interferase family)
MKGYYNQIKAMLQQHGFFLSRQAKGSHEMWSKGSVSVTVSTSCQSRFTANAIMRQAGIDHRF